MIAQGPLKPQQIIRYDRMLWRVEHVNVSRAYIVPLAKRHVVLGDQEFDATVRGTSIGANSYVEIVEDLERAKTEIELAAAERELAAVRREQDTQSSLREELAAAERELAAARQEVAAAPAPSGGWHLISSPACEPGSLKQAVVAILAAQPGSATKVVATACPGYSSGAVAACLDRFRKSGVVKRG